MGERGINASAAPRGRSGRWALGIIGAVVAAVVIEAAVRSWTIDRPSTAQVVICLVPMAAGAVWSWTWAAIVGLRDGTAFRLECNIKDAARRDKVVRRLETAQRRALLLKRHLPLAAAAFVAGFLGLLL